ncbi:hypothetical protein ACFWBH_32245 [Streptomyces sp. NPDC059999]|uniref:hypothetical protein n=1 Tax=unclassified Streptomyces TaxID=2593676 RepID=UPI0036CFE5A0
MRSVITVATVTVMSTSVLLVAPTMASAESGDNVSTSEVAAALNTTESENGDLVAEPVKTLVDTDSAAIVTKDGTTTDVPKDPEKGVSLGSVNVGLPNADEAKDAKRLSDGTVVYPGTDGSAQAVIPTGTGVQMLTTIANADAPTRYDYKVSVPVGGRVTVDERGNAAVLNGDNTPALVVPSPWAKDANGTAVPTHFETDGTTLTQVVERTSGGYAYPVVADPRIYYSWGAMVIKFDSWETGAIARAGAAFIGARFGGPAAAAFASFGGDWLARVAEQRRQCLVYRLVPYYVWASGLWIEKC